MTPLDRTSELVRGLALAGLGAAGPGVAADARGIAEDLDRAGLREGAGRLRALAEALGADAATSARALWALVVWLDLVRRGQDRAELRARLGSGPASAAVASVPVTSASVEVRGVRVGRGRIWLSGEDEDGRAVRIEDRLPDLDPTDPFDRPVASSLFRGPVVLRDVLTRRISLVRHPFEHRGPVRLFQPSLRAVARSGDVATWVQGRSDAEVRATPTGPALEGPAPAPSGPRVRAVLGRLLRATGREAVPVEVVVVSDREGPKIGCLLRGTTVWWGADDPRGFPLAAPDPIPPIPEWPLGEAARRAAFAATITPESVWPGAAELRALSVGERLAPDRLRALVASALGGPDEAHALALAVAQGWGAEWCG